MIERKTKFTSNICREGLQPMNARNSCATEKKSQFYQRQSLTRAEHSVSSRAAQAWWWWCRRKRRRSGPAAIFRFISEREITGFTGTFGQYRLAISLFPPPPPFFLSLSFHFLSLFPIFLQYIFSYLAHCSKR